MRQRKNRAGMLWLWLLPALLQQLMLLLRLWGSLARHSLLRNVWRRKNHCQSILLKMRPLSWHINVRDKYKNLQLWKYKLPLEAILWVYSGCSLSLSCQNFNQFLVSLGWFELVQKFHETICTYWQPCHHGYVYAYLRILVAFCVFFPLNYSFILSKVPFLTWK